MPPKKRKTGTTLLANRGKRARTGSSSIISEIDGASMISASGRPMRSTAGEPSYDQVRRHSRTAATKSELRKDTAANKSTKRGPGRPRISTTPTVTAPLAVKKATAVKIPVGRSPKTATPVETPFRKRGRPKKEVSAYVTGQSHVVLGRHHLLHTPG